MKIGCTGTRNSLNDLQIRAIEQYLAKVITWSGAPHELHHGDCVGADAQIAQIAKLCGYKVVMHPPIKDDLRAFHDSDEVKDPLSYFARNRNIVDQTDMLIVAPKENEWQPRGGTWYTHDYAVKKNKTCVIFYPNGHANALFSRS